MEHTITVNGCNIHVTDTGEGPTLILLHSLLCDSTMFDEFIQKLPAGYRIVTIDARAHGRTDTPVSRFSIGDLASDVLTVMDELSIVKAHVLGISMGGMVGLACARLAPDRVRSLTLVDTEARKPPLYNYIERWLLAAGSPVVGIPWFSIRIILYKMFGKTFRKNYPEIVNAWKPKLKAIPSKSLRAAIYCINNRPSFLERLEAVDTPTLLIYGDEDVYTPPSSGELIASKMQNARMKVLEKTGHLSIVEQPRAVADLVVPFIAHRNGPEE